MEKKQSSLQISSPLCCFLQVHFYISKQHKHIHSSRNKCKLHFSLFFTFIVVVFIYLNASITKVKEKMNIRTGEECSAHH